MLGMYAQLVNTTADVEEKSGKSFDGFLKEMFSSRLADLSKRLPRDVYGEFIITPVSISFDPSRSLLVEKLST
jgi:hypothetical protein